MKKKKCEDSCKSCGVPWHDHLGISGTCAKLEAARRVLRAVAREMTHGFTADRVSIKQLCDKTLESIK